MLQNTQGTFKDITPDILLNTGITNDAIWTDFDNDGQPDLLLVGEWTPPQFFRNNKGNFENFTARTGLGNYTGWWKCLAGGDFDNDGDTDYILGNFGENSYIKASIDTPVRVYAKDFDENGTLDAIMSFYDKNEDGELIEVPLAVRDALVDRIPAFKNRFNTYKSYSESNFSKVLRADEKTGSNPLTATILQSCYLENLGNGKFNIKPLSPSCQDAPISSILIRDFNLDGNLDALLVGNDYTYDPIFGNYDASNGHLLHGKGNGVFEDIPSSTSGIFLNKAQKSIVQAFIGSKPIIISGANSGRIKAYALNKSFPFPTEVVRLKSDGTYWVDNTTKSKKELYFSSSSMSQSSRKIIWRIFKD